MTQIQYPIDIFRRKTRPVFVGKVGIGGKNPIRIQSMLTGFTRDVTACIQEIRELVNAGVEMIRITIPNKRDLECVPEIKRRMKEEGLEIPLIADIHFAPHLAVDACEMFDKIRINPGNFSDRPKNSSSRSYEHFELVEGAERMEERLMPLIMKLKRYRRSLRIGVNQGSLSSRMIQHFGDSPHGMAESALEVVKILEKNSYFQFVISLKSSNPLVVQRAYRMLANLLPENSAPFHLGVTEAGSGDIARIKGLCGIGALLADGLGDTIRFSLTERSANEIEFAKKFLEYYSTLNLSLQTSENEPEKYEIEANQVRRDHRSVRACGVDLGGKSNVKIGYESGYEPDIEFDWDFSYKVDQGKIEMEDASVIFIRKSEDLNPEMISGNSLILFDLSISQVEIRKMIKANLHQSVPCGILIPEQVMADDFSLEIRLAQCIDEGIADYILVSANTGAATFKRFVQIMQATRVKLTETDYVACPSCGRTLFNLEKVTERIKEKTIHLKGVKIGIMGCIVNGPGEMADSDFGYVGSGSGKVDLYLGQTRVKKNIPEEEAVDELIRLIRENGRWIEPPEIDEEIEQEGV